MSEPMVFRPQTGATVGAFGVLPLLGLGLLGAGFWMGSQATSGVDWYSAISLWATSVLPLGLFAIMLSGRFEIRVDAQALTIAGVFGFGALRIPWSDMAAVGLASWSLGRGLGSAAVQGLAVRPARPWSRNPKRALHWDVSRGLLLIAGLEKWSAPADQIVATIRRHAGPKWRDSLENDVATN